MDRLPPPWGKTVHLPILRPLEVTSVLFRLRKSIVLTLTKLTSNKTENSSALPEVRVDVVQQPAPLCSGFMMRECCV